MVEDPTPAPQTPTDAPIEAPGRGGGDPRGKESPALSVPKAGEGATLYQDTLSSFIQCSYVAIQSVSLL